MALLRADLEACTERSMGPGEMSTSGAGAAEGGIVGDVDSEEDPDSSDVKSEYSVGSNTHCHWLDRAPVALPGPAELAVDDDVAVVAFPPAAVGAVEDGEAVPERKVMPEREIHPWSEPEPRDASQPTNRMRPSERTSRRIAWFPRPTTRNTQRASGRSFGSKMATVSPLCQGIFSCFCRKPFSTTRPLRQRRA